MSLNTFLISIIMLLLPVDTSVQSYFVSQIYYNSTESKLQCELKGYAQDVLWYIYAVIDDWHVIGTFVSGSQYNQSTIQATNVENCYISELTIIDGNAPFGPYVCLALTDTSYYYHSIPVSTGKTILSKFSHMHIKYYKSIGLGFAYKYRGYRNNSIILIQPEDFTYFRPAIGCLTDNSSFRSQVDDLSDWYYPSGRHALNSYAYYNDSFQQCSHQPYYLIYHVHLGILSHLVLERSFTESMNNCSGLYHCLIPDSYGELQQLFWGIYSEISKYFQEYTAWAKGKLNNYHF